MPARPEDRRRHPSFAVDWAVGIAWCPARRRATRLHDLSRGGAGLLHFEPEPAGRRGLLHVPGLSLPVPFTVIESRPDCGLHLRFDLERMGLDAPEAQREALCHGAGAA
jgi:methyl-accepting chemotaxis protein